jgi:signal transduction histidine kinase
MVSLSSSPALKLDALDREQLRRLIEVGPTLGDELLLDSVLERLLTAARKLTGARYAAVGVLDNDRRELERFIAQGIDEAERRAIGDLPRGNGVLGVLIREPAPLRLADVSQHPLSYGFPPGHPPMRTFLGVPVLIGGEAWGNLYLAEKDGGEFDEADEQAVCVLAVWAGIAIEHARLHARTEEQRDEAAYALRALDATTVISRALGAQVELEPTLELVVKRGRAIADARSMLVLLLEGEELVITAIAGEASTELLGARLPLQGSVSGKAVMSGKPQRLPDFAEQIGMTSRRAGLGLTADQFVGSGEHPALFVPMAYRGRMVGVLNVIGRVTKAGPFTDAEEQLITSFAASAATAVAAAQSVESDRLRLSLRAMEEERSRWARELHDETLQSLGALRVLLATTRRSNQAPEIDAPLERAIEQVTGEIRNLRSLITDLRPAALDEIGIAAALEGLLELRRGQTSLTIEGRIDLERLPGRLAPELETAVYRVVQEALTNIVKHADAQRAHVRVLVESNHLSADIQDDGRGFDTEISHSGFGLTGMRERVNLVGGELEVSSGAEGTQLTARFPLRFLEPSRSTSDALRLATDRHTV